VSDLVAEGPAAQAGLRRGDVVTEIDGQAVDDPESLGYRLGTKPIGASATMTVQRNGRKVSLPLKLVAAPETPARETLTLSGRSPFSGATVVNLSPAVTEELSIEGFREGVVIAEVAPGSTAAKVGLQQGDVILAVNDAKIARTADLQRAAEPRRNWWKLTLGRGGQIITTAMGG
jgi:S1-C subfamily serine protease